MADNTASQEVTNAILLNEIKHMQTSIGERFTRIDGRLGNIEETQKQTGKWIAAHDEKSNGIQKDITELQKGVEANRKRTTTMGWLEGVIAIFAGVATFLGIK